MSTRPFAILIADDHPQMRQVVRSLCADDADEFIEVGSGEEAVEAYMRNRPGCVLMDIEMPGMDGLAATRAIRGLHPEARIIVTTSHDTPAFRAQALAAGAAAFVSKDDLAEITQLTRRLCRGA